MRGRGLSHDCGIEDAHENRKQEEDTHKLKREDCIDHLATLRTQYTPAGFNYTQIPHNQSTQNRKGENDAQTDNPGVIPQRHGFTHHRNGS